MILYIKFVFWGVEFLFFCSFKNKAHSASSTAFLLTRMRVFIRYVPCDLTIQICGYTTPKRMTGII